MVGLGPVATGAGRGARLSQGQDIGGRWDDFGLGRWARANELDDVRAQSLAGLGRVEGTEGGEGEAGVSLHLCCLFPAQQRHPTGASGHADACGQVDAERGVFVDADDEQIVRQLAAQLLESSLAHVAAAGIEARPAVGVVPVRDEDERQVEASAEVQTRLPVQVGAGFVDFVDGQHVLAGGDGSGAGEHHRRAHLVPGLEDLPGQGSSQLPGGVGGAARTEEEDVGLQHRQ